MLLPRGMIGKRPDNQHKAMKLIKPLKITPLLALVLAVTHGARAQTITMTVDASKTGRRHFGTTPVMVSGNSRQHDVKGTVNFDKPKVSSGSDTYPLDVSAAFTSDRKALTIAIINPSDAEQEIEVALPAVSLASQGRLWQIAAAPWDTRNDPGKPRGVDIIESPVNQAPTRLTSPKLSLEIYEFPVQ